MRRGGTTRLRNRRSPRCRTGPVNFVSVLSMPRSLAATLTGLLAALLLPVSLVSVWVDGMVSDTDTYVGTVTPLADDDAVKAAAVTELQRAALQLVASSGRTLPAGGQKLVHLVVERFV